MNESIISPWFIYLLFSIDSFIGLLLILPCVLLGIPIMIYISGLIIIGVDGMSMYSKERAKERLTTWTTRWKKHLKYLIPLFICFLLMSTITPNKNTMIAMYVADQITYGKVEKTVQITNDIRNIIKRDAIEIINSVVTKNKEEIKK